MRKLNRRHTHAMPRITALHSYIVNGGIMQELHSYIVAVRYIGEV